MERTFGHSVTYTNSRRVSVADVAASLIANEKLAIEAVMALEQLYPGLKIEDTRTVFRRASSDSPLQEAIEVVASLIFQGDMTDVVPELVERITGWEVPDSMDGIVTILVIAIAAYGVYWIASKAGKRDADAGITIRGNYNQVLQVGSVVLNVPPEAMAEAVEGRFQKSRGAAIARRAMEFIRPAQREAGAAIEGGGVRIDPATIAAAPSPLDMELAEEEETQEPYANQEIVIHATDLDHLKSGWAGHLPGIWEKRLPMRLYPTIHPEQIYGRRTVVGDVIVVSRRSPDGEYVPYVFHVVGID